MATLSTNPAGSIIETATAYFGGSESKPASATNRARQTNPDTHKSERAMARRLEQIHAALGESEAASADNAARTKLPAKVNSTNSAGTGSLIITALISALLGAGVMRLTTHQESAAPQQSPALLAITAPAATPPTPREQAPVAASTTEFGDKRQISELLETWRNAWAQRDITGYLNAYSQEFSPIDGNTRDTWIAARTKKLSAGAPIDIQIRDLGIERLNADQFKATFLQDYASGNYREIASTKVMLITRENGEWKITKEWLAENKLAMK